MNKLTFFLILAIALILSACNSLPEGIYPTFEGVPTPIGANGQFDDEQKGCDTEATLFANATGDCVPLATVYDARTDETVTFRVMDSGIDVQDVLEPILVRINYVPSDPTLDKELDPRCLKYEGITFTCLTKLGPADN